VELSSLATRPLRRAGVLTAITVLASALTVATAGVAHAGPTQAPAGATQAPTSPVSSSARASAQALAAAPGRSADDAIRSYWTADRMKSAIPADTKSLDRAAADTMKAKGPVSAGTPARVEPAAPKIDSRASAGPAAPGVTVPNASGTAMSPAGQWYMSDWYGYFYGAPATTTGKVFFTGPDGWGYACSASAVNSEARNTVITAGHCVSDGYGNWNYNWVFVPDYYYGYAPYGMWTARELWTTYYWFWYTDFRYDVGAVVVNLDAYGRRLVDVVGGQGITWNQPRGQYVYDFGYPADPPFDGTHLKYCDNPTYDDFWSGWSNIGMQCYTTGGASGGPWLAYFSGYYGYVNGVNSFKYWWLGNDIFSPYFGTDAGNLYQAVRFRF